MYRPGQLPGRTSVLSWDLQAEGNSTSICLCLTWVLFWPPRRPPRQHIHFRDSYPIDVHHHHLSFNILCLLPISMCNVHVHVNTVKRWVIFHSPAGISLTKLFLAGNIFLFPARESLISDIPAGDGNFDNPFLQCKGDRTMAGIHEKKMAKSPRSPPPFFSPQVGMNQKCIFIFLKIRHLIKF
jgi:hypothetical protein